MHLFGVRGLCRKDDPVTQPRARDLVVLPPVEADPVFSEPLPLAQLIPAPRLGSDPQDFAALFIRHKWSFCLHARRFLSDQRDIDEVVQEGFLKLFLALPELETELQALAYCRRTITNLCIDRYRADQRRPHLIDLEDILDNPPVEDDDTDPLVQAEDAVIVREALAMLSPLHRAALVKREVEEKSLPQIALELDLPVEQVKHVLHRARRALRRLLVGTHVEPGVDLDLTLVLAANRDRAVRAAKPTSAAALAILVVLAGYFGLRPTASPQLLQGAPATVPFGSLFPAPGGRSGRPVAPTLPPVGPGRTLVPGAPSAPGRMSALRPSGRTVPSVPAVPGSPPASTAPTTAPSAAPVPTTSAVPTTAPTGAPTKAPPPSPTAVPVPTHTAVPVTPADDYVISGVGGSGQPAMSNQQSSLRSSGWTSSSTLSVNTAEGVYELRQAFAFAHDGTLLGVSLNELVPVSQNAAIGTLVSSTSSSISQLDDGAVRIRTSGTASAVAVSTGPQVANRMLTVDITLAADLAEVLAEKVQVTAPVDPAVPVDPAAGVAGKSAPVAPAGPVGLPAAPDVLAVVASSPAALRARSTAT